MIGIVQSGEIVAIGTTVTVVTRAALRVVVVLWSLRADEAGRRHARAILRLLGTDLRGRKGDSELPWCRDGTTTSRQPLVDSQARPPCVNVIGLSSRSTISRRHFERSRPLPSLRRPGVSDYIGMLVERERV
jgi:acyl-CoA hydrolase